MPGKDGCAAAVRAPGLCQFAGFLFARTRVEPEDPVQPGLHGKVTGRPDVRAALGEEKIDFGRPAADALDLHQFCNRCLVVFRQVFEVERAGYDQFAKRACVTLLLARKAAAAQGVEVGSQQGIGRQVCAQHRLEPGPDRSGRRHADLLADDRTQQCRIAALANPRFGIARKGQCPRNPGLSRRKSIKSKFNGVGVQAHASIALQMVCAAISSLGQVLKHARLRYIEF
ncbi:hypothetical protein SPHV1_110023 [Novosphingobium sp. KN65.2]|nr:hypothetical protein SPHV1_110023 [Novosphingobium sp. KN65.2]